MFYLWYKISIGFFFYQKHEAPSKLKKSQGFHLDIISIFDTLFGYMGPSNFVMLPTLFLSIFHPY